MLLTSEVKCNSAEQLTIHENQCENSKDNLPLNSPRPIHVAVLIIVINNFRHHESLDTLLSLFILIISLPVLSEPSRHS